MTAVLDEIAPDAAATSDARATSAVGSSASAGGLPRAPLAPRRQRRSLRFVVRPVLATVVAISALYFVQTRIVAEMIHEQLQHHLAADLKRPTPEVLPGHALGLLQIPSLGVNEVVVEGVSPESLRAGPTRASDSALPGDAGVMLVYGHRTMYGAPFEHVADLQQGDDLIVQARNGGPIVRYIVDRVERSATLTALELPNTDLISYLVLVTSEPGFFSSDQVAVVARSLPVTDASMVLPSFDETTYSDGPFSLDSLLAVASLAGAAMIWSYVRTRAGIGVQLAAVAPVAAFGLVRLAMVADTVLALTR